MKQHGSISNSKYQTENNVSKSTATVELKDLVTKNIFIMKGSKGHGVIYKLNNKFEWAY